MDNAEQRIKELNISKAEVIRKKIEKYNQKCMKRKLKLQSLHEERKTELEKLIEFKIQLATERKILNRLKYQNEIEKKVNH